MQVLNVGYTLGVFKISAIQVKVQTNALMSVLGVSGTGTSGKVLGSFSVQPRLEAFPGGWP